MATQPQTAFQALEVWRNGNKYLGDPDAGASDPDDVFADANRTIQLATMEGVCLDTLVPDETERETLQEHAQAFDDGLEVDSKHAAMMDGPEDS